MAADLVKKQHLPSPLASGLAGNQSSQVRERTPLRTSRAERRVAEYLRTLGIADSERVGVLAEQFSKETELEDPEQHARCAVALAQERFEAWRARVCADLAFEPPPLWLRAFLSEFPQLFLADPEEARVRLREFGDPQAGRGPVRAPFSMQALEPLRAPRWLRGLLPALVITFGASLTLFVALGWNGLSAVELAWGCLFGLMFGLCVVGFFTALFGVSPRFARRVLGEDPGQSWAHERPTLPRSALIMPVYHESAEHVFAAVAAMRESLRQSPGGEALEIFILSDSRDPALAAEEERAFRRIAASTDRNIPVFYRRRVHNHRQKLGNLSEFFERWGHRYEYVVVVDADSLMAGETIVELLQRLHASPQVALLQAPIVPIGGETLFARALQFASSLCGPLFTCGLSRWSGPDGNYYGHNAAIRVKAFLSSCALPALKGQPPFGGHIMSHDFVEAALLCREGWEVRIASDLGRSFEGLPPTLPEYVARDRRWCQGNFQHLRVAVARGLRPMSRLHLLLGVAAYLAGPAWLVFLLLGMGLGQNASPITLEMRLGLAVCTALVLLGPPLLGLIQNLRDRGSRQAHGGAIRLVFSVGFGILLAAVLAPLLMLHHARIVLKILFGRAVGWGSQRRHSKSALGSIIRSEGTTTLLGLTGFLALFFWAPELLGWLAPIWGPWSLAIPIAALASSRRAGAVARRLGLMWVPAETAPDLLIGMTQEFRTLTAPDRAAGFRDLVLDPVLLSAHLSLIEGTLPLASPEQIAELRLRALRTGPAALSERDRELLSSDPGAMRWLHREAWRHWPVESWQVARERPQVPPDSNALGSWS